MSVIAFGRSLGMTDEDLREGVRALETAEGRRAIAKAVREAREAQREENA